MAITLEKLEELIKATPTEMLAFLTNIAASHDTKKAEEVCQKILGMLDDAEKAGKAYLEGSIEKEKTIAVLAVVSQLKELVKNHLPEILCPPPFVRQVVSRVLALFSGCFSKSAVAALPPVAVPAVSPLSSDVAAVEARLAVRDALAVSADAEADPAAAPAEASAPAEAEKK
jgi:hypothetical protein